MRGPPSLGAEVGAPRSSTLTALLVYAKASWATLAPMPPHNEALERASIGLDVALTVACASIRRPPTLRMISKIPFLPDHSSCIRSSTATRSWHSVRAHAISRVLVLPSLVALLSPRSTRLTPIAAALRVFPQLYFAALAASVLIYCLSPFHPLACYPP